MIMHLYLLFSLTSIEECHSRKVRREFKRMKKKQLKNGKLAISTCVCEWVCVYCWVVNSCIESHTAVFAVIIFCHFRLKITKVKKQQQWQQGTSLPTVVNLQAIIISVRPVVWSSHCEYWAMHFIVFFFFAVLCIRQKSKMDSSNHWTYQNSAYRKLFHQ